MILPELSRCSLNTATIKKADLPHAVELAAAAGLGAVGLWRDRVQEVGAREAARIVNEAGLRVSSLCRGGFLTAQDEDGVRTALDDNRRAIEEAATVGTTELVFVVGGLPACSAPGAGPLLGATAADRHIGEARSRVSERVAELVPIAAEHGVRIVLEPLHPMFAADRAVISTLGQALDIAGPFEPATVGVVIDTYHVWWDPQLEASIARAGREQRIASYQVCDWSLPIAADPLLSRGHVGDGYIDFATITRWVAAAGYGGDVETEIFNQHVWDTDPGETVGKVTRRFTRHVEPHL